MEEIKRILAERGYEYVTPGEYFILEEDEETYRVDVYPDGTLYELRKGNGEGCFYVLDGAYENVQHFLNNERSWELERQYKEGE